MSHEEQRTTRGGLKSPASAIRPKSRPLSLLILIALAALASACATADDSNSVNRRVEQPVQYANANTSNANASVAAESADEAREVARGESYAKIDENPFLEAARAPLSTFSIDVDTASYSNTRRFLNDGQLPPRDAVRIEELVNYFTYDYPQPDGQTPFSVTAEVAECPWNTQHKLVHIGLQGKKMAQEELPPANLVFLIDVSGSMNEPDKLPLVKSSLRTLANQLTPRDRVAVVVYAGASGLVLPSTPGD